MIPTDEIEFTKKEAIAEFVFSIGNAVRIANMFKHLDVEARDFLKEVADELRKLEPKEEEVFYKIGDRFKCRCGGIYKLSMIGNNRVSLVKVEKYDGDEVGIVWYTKTYSVNDPSRITQKEFERISDRDPSWFAPNWYTLIKDEEEKEPEEKHEEEKKEVYCKVGDRFESAPGAIFRLSSLGNNRVALVKVEGKLEIGHITCVYDYTVKDPGHITQKEFSRISDGRPYCFTLMKS